MKPIFQISSTKEDQQAESVLAIKIGERHFGFAIYDPRTNELYQLSFYTAEAMDGIAVSGIIGNHPELSRVFSRVLVSYDHTQSLLMPSGRFDRNDANAMLQEIYGVNGLSVTVTESIPGWQLQNAFAVPSEIQDMIQDRFSPTIYQHHYSIGIKTTDLTAAETLLRVDFRTDEFSLILIHQNKLVLAQTYFYTAPADVIFILLNVCRQYNFSQELVRLELSGLIEKDSALFRDIYQYFLDVSFRTASWAAPVTEGQEYPAHFFTSFNDLALCES